MRRTSAHTEGRLAHQDELDRQFADWTRSRDRGEVARLLLAAGVPAAAVAMPEDRVDHDVVTADWGLWPTVRHTLMGEVRVEGLPVHLSRTDWVIDRGAPCLGEHNEQILGGPPRPHARRAGRSGREGSPVMGRLRSPRRP